LGPGDRVKKAQSFAGTKYSQEAGKNLGIELRTGNSANALEYLDCSELVSRVLAADGLTNGVKAMNTEGLKKFLANEDKFIRSKNEPKSGDIFLWRANGAGHTGIVVSYDPKTGIVITAEAKSTKDGTKKEVSRKLSVFTGIAGWEGFFRPNEENNDENDDENNVNPLSWDTLIEFLKEPTTNSGVKKAGPTEKNPGPINWQQWSNFLKQQSAFINQQIKIMKSKSYDEYLQYRNH